MPLLLPSVDHPIDARICAPSSKSVTHRALVAAALAEGDSEIIRPLDARDTRATLSGLEVLGIPVSVAAGRWTVRGQCGRIAGGGRLDLEESGTSLRLLTAVAALGTAASRIDGAARLRQRPLSELIATLRTLGARVVHDRLPLEVGGTPLRGGDVRVDGSRSSQFASALMLIGPYLEGGLRIRMEPPAVSLPYVELTRAVMRDFGVETTTLEALTWRIPAGRYRATEFSVDGDHSSASYFMAAPLVVGGCVRVERIDPGSVQADACFPRILERLGARVRSGETWIEIRSDGGVPAFDLSMGHAPDLVPTVAALALFSDGPSVIRDIAHLRLKESDRMRQLAVNLRRLGRPVEIREDRLEIGGPGTDLQAARIETAGDHRIAMAFALVGLRVPGLSVDDADCVTKSNPNFWNDWKSMLIGHAEREAD
jgi:3-phosphoshikimate 1-carboxyvinyltransferase